MNSSSGFVYRYGDKWGLTLRGIRFVSRTLKQSGFSADVDGASKAMQSRLRFPDVREDDGIMLLFLYGGRLERTSAGNFSQ